ncbi:TetR/AcrR family transcriptional regulator [Hungatella sp. L12]|uniref:TetR/AcrR family transcriptional regulator n=1 Tax=Hungatella hominis TaxID=2763050 RepID=A0ABR7H6H8_9FIRM|nr:TetR/AcrR family transcriptional regulator [Hungatella hominis]MBC5708777.1 TetR/AcrR family transcriptional regulator [Hungatella hominis]
MKREEKNQQTRRRILESALAEFSEQGYGASSVNTISNGDGLSKGIIYHYFPTKDDLYLACVEECFQTLTGHLQSHTNMEGQTAEERLEQYFRVRLDFFEQNPQYQRIFCDAVIMPPAHLEASIQEKKAPFDRFNIDSLNRMLEPVSLRSDLSREDVVDTFRQYQDYINARYQMTGSEKIDIRDHEESCRRALRILLYGIVERKE